MPDSRAQRGKSGSSISFERELHEDERNFYTVDKVEGTGGQHPKLWPFGSPAGAEVWKMGIPSFPARARCGAEKLRRAEDSKFEQVACIIETGDIPEQLQELRLIFANSATREMSSADKAKQAERVEVLLYELKEQGVWSFGPNAGSCGRGVPDQPQQAGPPPTHPAQPCTLLQGPVGSRGSTRGQRTALASMPEEVQERIKRVFPKKTPTGGAVREYCRENGIGPGITVQPI